MDEILTGGVKVVARDKSRSEKVPEIDPGRRESKSKCLPHFEQLVSIVSRKQIHEELTR